MTKDNPKDGEVIPMISLRRTCSIAIVVHCMSAACAVEKAVAAQSPGTAVRGFSKETENSQTYYEVELIVNGYTKDILIDTTGAIVEVEEEVVLDSLPAEVKAGLLAKAGKGKIGNVESITKHDRLVAYEAHVDTNGKKSESQVGPDPGICHHLFAAS